MKWDWLDFTCGAVVAASLSALALPSCDSLVDHARLTRDLEQLTEMNAQMLLQIEEIGRDIEAMKNPRKVEHIIRDELGYGHKNDLTLVF